MTAAAHVTISVALTVIATVLIVATTPVTAALVGGTALRLWPFALAAVIALAVMRREDAL